ncbi:cobyric acid synthase [Candidatus Magnetomonas plexicatena]|uniref:cobyric acid synthase n=1 Tax=Candidatus Magnetomonas plexicatena TaxID=2552947 RepID=UPI001C756EA1|nr:cobyric acid synthase [Nitrospirales bacterium LBB_01]
MAAAIMVQGTGSGAGKSLIVAALCRLFKNAGYSVAPFKSQNMALNSYVTIESGEIGRAQALQAEAAGIPPSIYHNPILLKSEGSSGSQVVVMGKPFKTMTASDYYKNKELFWPYVVSAWEELNNRYEIIVIEGAGSPAEINLTEQEIVNMAVARLTSAPVLLVGDIDKGGVFASLYGTAALLKEDVKLIKGFVINKFRGDVNILIPGNVMITDLTGIPVIGVIPYVSGIGLEEEDSLALGSHFESGDRTGTGVKITVLRLNYISNFTDFHALSCEPGVELVYSLRDNDILNSDLVIIPGTKNTVKDLLFLKETGVSGVLQRAVTQGIPLMGMCGGYQMLGKVISDPDMIESRHREVRGLGFLDAETVFESSKVTLRVTAKKTGGIPFIDGEFDNLDCYEIHMGQTKGGSIFKVRVGDETYMDGESKGGVWGTYLHGIFDNDTFRAALLDGLRAKRGLKQTSTGINYIKLRNDAIECWSATVAKSLDMDLIYSLLIS